MLFINPFCFLSFLSQLTYIEPFIGGGAMLFYMLKTHSNITRAVINDINEDLTTCYLTVRDHPNELIKSLRQIQMQYHTLLDEDARRDYYMAMRDRFNTKVTTFNSSLTCSQSHITMAMRMRNDSVIIRTIVYSHKNTN